MLGRRSRKQARKKLLTGLEELAAVFVRTRFAVWTRWASATTACERLKQCLVPPCMYYSHLLCLSVRLTPPFSSAPAAVSALEVSRGDSWAAAEEQLLGLFTFPEDDVLFTSF